MSPDDLNRTLYALSCIGDHVEALSAYQALASLYPAHRDAIKAAFKRDQCDWWIDLDRYFAPDLDPLHQRRYAEYVDACKLAALDAPYADIKGADQ